MPVAVNVFDYSITFKQPLYTAGKVGTALRIASIESEGAQLDVDRSQQDLALQVVRAAYALMWAERYQDAGGRDPRTAEAARRDGARRFAERCRHGSGRAAKRGGSGQHHPGAGARRQRHPPGPGPVELLPGAPARFRDRDLHRLPGETLGPVGPGGSGAAGAARPPGGAASEDRRAQRGVATPARQGREQHERGLQQCLRNRRAFPEESGSIRCTPAGAWASTSPLPVFDGFRRSGLVTQATANQRAARLEREKVEQQVRLGLQQALDEIKGRHRDRHRRARHHRAGREGPGA